MSDLPRLAFAGAYDAIKETLAHPQNTRILLDKHSNSGWTPLTAAAYAGQHHIVTLLLALGARTELRARANDKTAYECCLLGQRNVQTPTSNHQACLVLLDAAEIEPSQCEQLCEPCHPPLLHGVVSA